mgnify:FL=1
MSHETLPAQGPVDVNVMPHTPGPWTVMSGDNYEIRSKWMPREYPHHFKGDSTGDFVAYIGNHAAAFGKANARLIAAAPALLAALELMVERIQEPPSANCSCFLSPPCSDCVNYGGEREAFEAAHAAIAAALGHNAEIRGDSGFIAGVPLD